jgi:hypothetical protein
MATIVPSNFNWQSYVQLNPDLATQGVDTEAEARQHYANYGWLESRPGVTGATPAPFDPESYAIVDAGTGFNRLRQLTDLGASRQQIIDEMKTANIIGNRMQQLFPELRGLDTAYRQSIGEPLFQMTAGLTPEQLSAYDVSSGIGLTKLEELLNMGATPEQIYAIAQRAPQEGVGTRIKQILPTGLTPVGQPSTTPTSVPTNLNTVVQAATDPARLAEIPINTFIAQQQPVATQTRRPFESTVSQQDLDSFIQSQLAKAQQAQQPVDYTQRLAPSPNIPVTPPEPLPTDQAPAGFARGGSVDAFIRNTLAKKFGDGGSAGSSSGVRRLKMSGYQAGGDVSPAMMTPEQLDEFNRNLQRELDEENRRFEKSGGPEFYSAIRPAMEDINERVKQTLELYRMGRATEADVQKLLPSLSEYEIASQFGRTDTGGYRSRDVDAPSRDRLREFIEIQKPTIDANRPDMFPYEKYDPRGPRAQGRVLEMSKGGDVTDEMFVGTRPEDFPETSVVDKKAGELLRALSEGTRGFVDAEPIEPGSEAYRTGQALANMPAVGVVAATAKGAGKAKDALKALTKKDIKLIASELETSRGQLAELAKKYPQLRDASVADIEALTKGEPFTAFRGISLLPGRELQKESTPSMTVDPSVALGMLKDAPVMITKEGFITATPVLRQYPGMKASETQVYVPSLIEQITERQPGALEMKIPTRSGEKMTVADVFKEVKGEKELLADVSKKEPRDILFDRYQGGVGDRYLMEVARRVLAGKWEGGEALLKEIGGYQTDPKGLVQEFDSFAELVKESALKKAQGGEVTNDEFIQEMMTGTRPTDETTSPGILPPEIRQAVDVPLDFANLLIRGTAAVPIGGVAGLYKGITGGKYGTQEGVKEADTEAARMMAKITGEPKTQTAKDVLEFIGGKAQEYKLDAALPQLLTLPSPGPGAASALMRSYELAETPPLGTVKLAGDKGVKPATPPTDQMGFYSPAEKAVMGLPQDKGTASQMLAQITKTQGVKPVELRATGLEDYLKGKGNEPVTKQEIQDFLTNNRVQVDEVVLGKGQTLSPEAKKLSGEALSRMEEVDNKLASYFEGVEEVAGQDPYSAFIMLRSSIGRRAAKGDQEALDELNAFNLPPEIKDLVLEFGRNKNEYIKYTSQARKMEKPKFDRYNTPGGQNAREIYLTLPGEQMPSSLPPGVNAQGVLVKPMDATQPKFTAPSPHSVSPEADANRLAHIFLDERKDAKGNNVLFVQEMQSDWAQQGRDKGFRTPPDPIALEAAKTKISQAEQALRQKSEELFNRGQRVQDSPERLAALEQVVQAKNELETLMQNSRLPPAPFVSTQQYQVMKDGKPLVTKNKKDQDVPHIYSSPEDAQRAAERFGGTVKDIGMQENTEGWVNLALKRVIKEAVDNDIDTVAFIKGGQAADKYSLRTFVDHISADRGLATGDDLYVSITPKDSLSPYVFYVGPDGIIKDPISADVRRKFLGEPLSNVIGKEAAEKLLSTKIGESQVLRDEGLTLGGKGMEGFYDNILPKTAEKLLKKLGGGKVEPVEMVKAAPSQMPYEANAFLHWMSFRHPGTSRSDAARAWGMGMDNNQFVKEFYEETTPKADQYLGFKITPEMKEMVKTEGLPKFAAGGEVTDFIKRAA